jgi:hypothetical protein
MADQMLFIHVQAAMSVRLFGECDLIFDPGLESAQSATRLNFSPISRGPCLLGIVGGLIVDMHLSI